MVRENESNEQSREWNLRTGTLSNCALMSSCVLSVQGFVRVSDTGFRLGSLPNLLALSHMTDCTLLQGNMC